MTKWIAGLSLAFCAATPFLYFWGAVPMLTYKYLLAAGSLGWFVFATMAVARKKSN
jgi:hypothetical protein